VRDYLLDGNQRGQVGDEITCHQLYRVKNSSAAAATFLLLLLLIMTKMMMMTTNRLSTARRFVCLFDVQKDDSYTGRGSVAGLESASLRRCDRVAVERNWSS